MAVNVDIEYTGKFDLPIPIKRLNPVPTDTTSIWDTKANAQTYAQSGATAYVGQILFVQADNKLYKIKNTAGDLEEVGSGKAGFLSYWDCKTGLATDTFADLPYTYKKGDYFRAIPNPDIGEEGEVNYIPSGSTYDGTASTTTATQSLTSNAIFTYNGSTWSISDSIEYTLPTASASVLGGIKVGSGLSISSGVLSVLFPTASGSTLGMVKQGTNITIASDGTISGAYGVFSATGAGLAPQAPTSSSEQTTRYLRGDGTWSGVVAESVAAATSSVIGGILSQTTGTTTGRDYVVEVASDGKAKVNVPWTDTPYTLPTASASVLGGIKVGNHLTIDENGILSAEAGAYTLPIASSSTLGGIKVGSNLTINASTGVLSAVNTTYSVFTTSANGLVPSASGASAKFLRGDATWQTVITEIPIATDTTLGAILSQTTGTTADRDYVIEVDSEGKAKVNVPWTDTTYNVFTTLADGLVPASGENTTMFLRGDGTWASPSVSAAAQYAANALDAAMEFTVESIEDQPVFDGTTAGIVPLPTSTSELKFLKCDGSWATVEASIPIATASTIGGIKVGQNLTIDPDTGVLSADAQQYILPIASASSLGGIKVGNNLSIDSSTGVLSATDTVYTLPVATSSTLGGVKIGTNISVTASGVISIPTFTGADNGLVPATTQTGADYVLNCLGNWVQVSTPVIATTTTAGIVKVGRGLTITDSVLNSNIASSSTLGMVKIGSGLTVTGEGLLSANLPYATETTAGIVKIGANIFIDSNGVISSTDTIYDVFTTQIAGLVPPASNAGDTAKFLRGDGTWQTAGGGGGGGAVNDVQVVGTSVLDTESAIANIPAATRTTYGAVKKHVIEFLLEDDT